jgi:tetratricopeptide (TPR) repeat protein
MKTLTRSFAFAALLLVPAAALPADSSPAVRVDPVLEQVSNATARKDWPQAQAVLRDAVARDPANADYHNLYAYSIRKGANPDMNLVFKHYNEALRLDPKHRGAHEYIGEAYLMVGNLPKAKEHLSSLNKLCFFPCQEFTDLKRAVSDFEAKGK